MTRSRHLLYCAILGLIALTVPGHGSIIYQDSLLKLEDRGVSIENTIKLNMKEAQHKKLKIISGEKLTLKNLTIEVNSESFRSEKINTRGNNSLKFRRKSLSIGLEKKAGFYRNGQKTNMKKFYAVNLSMDKNYIRNRLAYGMMEEIGMFHLFYGYANLEINNQSEGIYMILERPQDWAMKIKNSPLVIRRGYSQEISKIKTGKKISNKAKRQYVAQYKKIYKSLNRYEGKVLYDSLSKLLDLELYMKWLAFNYFVKNGDYTDEVYFCVDPKSNTFKFIPWDYDDIFAIQPHEGFAARKKTMRDLLIYSSEDKLDLKIGSDSYLYAQYLNVLKTVLETLSEDSMKSVFEQTYAEIYPYLDVDEIISMSRFDEYKNVSKSSVREELNKLYINLLISRNTYLPLIEDL